MSHRFPLAPFTYSALAARTEASRLVSVLKLDGFKPSSWFGAQCFLLEECVVEEERLTPQEMLVVYSLRKGKTSEEAGKILGRKVGTGKKTPGPDL